MNAWFSSVVFNLFVQKHKQEFKATPVHISAEISLEAIPDDRKDHLDW